MRHMARQRLGPSFFREDLVPVRERSPGVRGEGQVE